MELRPFQKQLPGFAQMKRVMITVLLLIPSLASAQDVTEPALKAAFIYNFAKFTEWPLDIVPATAPIVMCMVGDTAVKSALEQMVKDRLLAGHSITVLTLAPTAPGRDCQILYVSAIPASDEIKLIAGLRDFPVLTISDSKGFTDIGGIAQFFFEQGQLRFSIRYESVKRAHLQISAKLLAMAKQK